MKILFLHGWQSTPGGRKPTYLKDHGHSVLNPALPDDDFDAAVRIAQAEYDQHHPDVIVGSSRGGAVAMNIDSGQTPLVLLCPAWKRWATASTVKPGTIILHSRADDVIPIADSEGLLRNSGLPESALVVVGTEHRLADPESLEAMLEAVEKVVGRTVVWTESNFIDVEDVGDFVVVRFRDLDLVAEGSSYVQLHQELLAVAAHEEKDFIIVDFQGRTFMLCSYFNYMLVNLGVRCRHRLKLCNVPPFVTEYWHIAKIDELLRIYPTLEEAISAK